VPYFLVNVVNSKSFLHMPEKNETFPNGLEAFLLFVVLFIAEYLAGAALYDMRGVLGIDPSDVSGLVALLGNAIVFTFVMEYKQLSYKSLFHSSSASKTATLLVLGPAITLTVPAILLMLGTLTEGMLKIFPLSRWEEAAFARMGSGSFAAIVMVCVLAPVLEEMFFRGIILRSFLRQYPKWTAILGSATLFGFAHMNLYQFVGALITGVFLGWLYERTRSLLPCIWLHAVYNSACLVVPACTDSGANDFSFTGVPAVLWGGAFLLALTGAWILQLVLVGAKFKRQ
jgi:membrane protease YdiL (CAAX protease family)